MRAAIYARCTPGLRPSVDLRGLRPLRYSSENQREQSIDDQIRVCRQFAARDGIALAGAAPFDNASVVGLAAELTAAGLLEIPVVEP
jgi:hypothetical protein